MNVIFNYKQQSKNSKYTLELLSAAEQRINFVYMIIMIAFEASILIYILLNSWDDTRFYFGGISGGALLIGISVDLIFRKKSYPWIKFVNNLIIMFAVFMLCGLSDFVALLFILIPFINSFYFRPRFSALTGIICLLLMYIAFMSVLTPIYADDGRIDYNFFKMAADAFDFPSEDYILILRGKSFLIIIAAALVIVSVCLSMNSRRFTIRQGELLQKNLSTETELNVARDIQEGILSTEHPDNPSYAVYAEMASADEVGGDFYDYFLVDETHLAIVIGDVSGHGMAAAMFMTLSKTLIKVYAQAHYAADKVFELTNRYLQSSNPAKFFVTGWIGMLDLTTGVLTYTNAGHNFPVIVRAGKEPEFLRSKPNFVLGRKRMIRYTENRIKLDPGDKLVLYTDGVTEARAPDESFFGDERLLQTVGAAKEQNQKEITKAIREAVTAFENGGKHQDDATVLALCFKEHLQIVPPKRKVFFLNVNTFDSVTEYIAEQCSQERRRDRGADQVPRTANDDRF